MSLLDQLKEFCYSPIKIERGQHLLNEGESCDQVYVLISGKVRVTTGNVIIGDFSTPGNTFGEMAVMLKEPVSATVVALDECQVYVIKSLDAFLIKNPEECIHMLRTAYRRLCQMNRGVNILFDQLNP